MKNIILLTFLFLVISCGSDSESPSDWSEVELKIQSKDSIGASKLAKQVEPAIQNWAGYPDVRKAPDSSATISKEE